MKPTFLIPGIGKCGTTTLAHLLGQHPEVCMASTKEPDFFSFEANYEKGWGWYESLFHNTAQTKVCGEASVSYHSIAHEEKVYQRIAKHLPDIKIILIARNPYQRLESVYREAHDNGHMSGVAVSLDLAKAMAEQSFMVEETKYWTRSAIVRKTISASNILYICLEDLQANQATVLKTCFQFLGVDTSYLQTENNAVGNKAVLNQGNTKMYDTWLARTVRQNMALAGAYRNFIQPLVNKKMQQALIKLIRREFNDQNIYWNPDFRRQFTLEMKGEVQAFLAHCNKPADYWGNEFI